MNAELLNKLKHLANIAAHLPHDVTLEDEDAAMKALHGELAADTVLQMIALAERTTAPASPTDEKIIQRFESHIDTGPDCFDLQDGDSAYWIKQSEMVKFARALLAAAPALIQQVPTAWCTDAHFEPWCERHDMRKDRGDHRQMFDDAASLYLTVPATPPALAGSQVQAGADAVQCTLGVGSGNGNLFVVGDYDSIKAAQAWILRAEKAESRLAEIQRGVEGLPTWTMRNIDGSYRDLVDLQQVLELLGKRDQVDTSGLPG